VTDPRTPVVVAVGQVVDHWNGRDPAAAPSPVSLAAEAARRALADSGAGPALAGAVDRAVAVRTMLDSIPGAPQPFGRCANLPLSIARAAGIAPREAIYSVVGGDQPQALVNEAAEAVFAGDVRAVLIAGAEATAAMKAALRAGHALGWSASAEGPLDDRGLGAPLLTPYELANGLGMPTMTYPAFEHALRARLGLDRAAYTALMSELWAGFSTVAAANPYAQFPQARSAEFLATPSAENYPVSDPYLKWHVAQDAVNQGAAVVVTTVATADALGIAADKRVFLHGYAAAKDATPTARPDLSRSRAIAAVLAGALDRAGKATADIAAFDLYSCFPCAVLLAAEALGLDWRAVPATVTGGLPFFGGAGNNYSLHAIATMAERLRAAPGSFGLVLANGGFLSKEAAGVYSTEPPPTWQPQSSAALQATIDAEPGPPLVAADCEGRVETYTVTYAKGQAQQGYVVAATAAGRVLARTRRGDAAVLAELAERDPVGRTVRVEHADGVNRIAAIA